MTRLVELGGQGMLDVKLKARTEGQLSIGPLGQGPILLHRWFYRNTEYGLGRIVLVALFLRNILTHSVLLIQGKLWKRS